MRNLLSVRRVCVMPRNKYIAIGMNVFGMGCSVELRERESDERVCRLVYYIISSTEYSSARSMQSNMSGGVDLNRDLESGLNNDLQHETPTDLNNENNIVFFTAGCFGNSRRTRSDEWRKESSRYRNACLHHSAIYSTCTIVTLLDHIMLSLSYAWGPLVEACWLDLA
jgi:hypothetical protein